MPFLYLAPEVRRLALASQGWRGLISVLALALGVALGYGVNRVHGVAVAETEGAARRLAGEADLLVQSVAPAGIEEALYARLAARPEVEVASPVLEVEAKVPARREDRRDRLRLLGIDIFQAGQIQPAFAAAGSPRDLLQPDRVFLNPAALAWLGVGKGDALRLQAGAGEVALVVAGTVDLPGQPFGIMDIAGLQAAFGPLGRLSRVELRLRPGVAKERAAADLGALLPPGVRVESPAARSRQVDEYTRAYRVNLAVLSLVALFTGALLVFSSQALAVLRRRRQLALLRTLGLTRRELLVILLGEAALLGLIGGVIGVALGQVLARLLLAVTGADLGGAYFQRISSPAGVDWGVAALFLGLGLFAALAGSLPAILEAARAPPARALHAGDEPELFARRPSLLPGLALLALGALASQLPPVARLPVFGYFAVIFCLLGAIALLPRITAGCLALAARLPLGRRPWAELALLQLRGAAGQVSLSLAPLVASIAVAAAMAIMVGSFRTSLENWLDRLLPADLYLRVGMAGDSAYLDAAGQARLATIAGIGRLEFRKSLPLSLAPEYPPVTLLAREVDPRQPAAGLPMVGDWRVPAGEYPGVWISEAMADLYGWRPGQVVSLPVNGRPLAVEVAGVWRDYARSGGAVVLERAVYAAASGDATANEVALWLAPGADPGAVTQALEAAFPPGWVEVEAPRELKRLSFSLFDRTFAATYALEAAAIGVGLAGLSASFAALVLARRREFGVLRHLGLERRQIRAMLAGQGSLLALVALVTGFALSGAIAWILIEVINRQSFHWSMDIQLPWLPLSLFALAVALLAAGTAAASGGLAMRREAALAVREDW